MRLLLLLFLFHFTLSAPISEYRALLSLREAITDATPPSLSSWNASTSHCSWSGVTCDPHRHVIALNLTGLGLTGTLSADVAHLPFLSNLSLADNELSGPIPPSLSAVAGLRFLNLSNNGFNGTFPSELSILKSLEVLDLYNNNLTGVLPLAVTQLPNLRHLHLGGNFFSGQIPPEYGQWKHLEYLAVSGNELAGAIPPEIGTNILSVSCSRTFSLHLCLHPKLLLKLFLLFNPFSAYSS